MRRIIAMRARRCGIPVCLIERSKLKETFGDNARNKYTIAAAVTAAFPELARQQPTKRKIWQAEQYQMSVFDAAAALLTYTRTRTKLRKEDIPKKDRRTA
jgi:hypothetical protein